MNPKRSLIAGAATLLLAVLLLASNLPAQQPRAFTSTFYFGDSLTDSGNTFALTGQPPPPYFNGRFSNGPTYAEYLTPGLQLATTAAPTVQRNLNFAFGGATAAPGSLVPSLGQQLGLFQQRQITPGANDLFVVLAGANDVINAIANPSTQNPSGVGAAATAASAAVGSHVQSLFGAGARNIVVIGLPRIAMTPRFATGSGAPAAPLAQHGSSTFNLDLGIRLQAASVPSGARLTYFDFDDLFGTIVTWKDRLGLPISSQEYLGVALSGQNPGDVGNYVFWDGIHPSTKAHALVANALSEVANPELVLGVGAAIGSAQHARTEALAAGMEGRLDTIHAHDDGASRRAGLWSNVTLARGGRHAAGHAPSSRFDAETFTFGYDFRAWNFRPGIAVTTGGFDAQMPGAEYSSEESSVTVYTAWDAASWFADASYLMGRESPKSRHRTTALGLRTAIGVSNDFFGLPGTTAASSRRTAFELRAGRQFAPAGVRLAPWLGLRSARTRIGAFTESNVPGLDFAYERQVARSTTFLAGVNAGWTIPTGVGPIDLTGRIILRNGRGDHERSVRGQLASNVGIGTPVEIRTADGDGNGFTAGVQASIPLFSARWNSAIGYEVESRSNGRTGTALSAVVQRRF